MVFLASFLLLYFSSADLPRKKDEQVENELFDQLQDACHAD